MKKDHVIAFIPAAGLGGRLYPITKVIPKEMFPIGNKPVIHYLVESLVRAGLRDVLIAIRPQKHAIKEYLKDGSLLGARIRYVTGSPIGIDHTLRAAMPYLAKNPFLLVVGDLFVKNPKIFQELVAHYKRHRVSIDALTRDRKREFPSFAVPVAEKISTEFWNITSYRAQRTGNHAPLVSLGISILPPTFFSYFPRKSEREISLGDLMNIFMRHEQRLGFETKNSVHDCSTPEGLLKTTRYVLHI